MKLFRLHRNGGIVDFEIAFRSNQTELNVLPGVLPFYPQITSVAISLDSLYVFR